MQTTASSLQNPVSLLRRRNTFLLATTICSLSSRLSNLALVIVFFSKAGGVFLSWLLLAFVLLATLFDVVISVLNNTRLSMRIIGLIFSILQLKSIIDALKTFSSSYRELYNQTNFTMLNNHRSELFRSSTLQSLPISAILCYILLLDLDTGINHNLLITSLTLSILSFSLGTTLFVAGDDPMPFASVIVFTHVLSQFCFRMLAICMMCIMSPVLGLTICAISLVLVHLFGPDSAWSAWVDRLTCRVNPHGAPHALLFKLLTTPITFFVVLRPLSSKPRPFAHLAVVASDCFQDTTFSRFRLFENIVMVTSFLVWQMYHQHAQYVTMLHWPRVVIAISLFCAVLIWVTWAWVALDLVVPSVSSSSPYQSHMSLNSV
eukprot:c25969_g1_i1.p1 GENE.c25969_g1_i1~~c25969_g1_i1.p1  ORF type:complete len:398 (-),score=73.78 c25969_g1_i1:124-1251(-)